MITRTITKKGSTRGDRKMECGGSVGGEIRWLFKFVQSKLGALLLSSLA
ncbi:hypothetical protein [Sphingobacterium siyangense]|nr:hypothetical protein [Sphingobacterium siyangense]